MSSSEFLIHIEKYVRDILSGEEIKKRAFHSINHTIEVVMKCEELASYYNVSPADSTALIAAAWFHDTGYLNGSANHEIESAKIALNFLKSFLLNSDYLKSIEDLILATTLPSKPVTLLEEIICDADLHHLGSIDYKKWSLLLRQELERFNGITFLNSEWARQNISFFETHHYFTPHAQKLWSKQKQQNLSQLYLIATNVHS